MDTKLKKKWIKALRSGKYQQTSGSLYDGEGYCCLGRLCVVLGKKFVLPLEEPCPRSFRVEGQLFNTVLPPNIAEEAGMLSFSGEYISNGIRCQLSVDNDAGTSFAKIADIIEEHWKEL